VARDGGRRRGTLGGNDAQCGVSSGTVHSRRLEVKAPLEDGAPAQQHYLGTRGHRRRVQWWQKRAARRAGAWQERKRKKGGALRWGAPLKAARGGGRWRWKRWAGTVVETVGEAVGMDKAVATAVRRRSAQPGRLYSYREADGWAPHGFDFFPIYQKPAQLSKFKKGTLSCSKNSQFLHAARLGYYKKLYKLC
jgi:hypothetical protein